jgi:ABC-2 type transport system permease protein
MVETLRALLSGRPAGGIGWTAVAWCLGTAVVAYGFALRAYKRIP